MAMVTSRWRLIGKAGVEAGVGVLVWREKTSCWGQRKVAEREEAGHRLGAPQSC